MDYLVKELMNQMPPGLALIALILFYIIKVLIQVREAVNQTNGSVGRLQEWAKGHEKRDDDRFEALQRIIEDHS